MEPIEASDLNLENKFKAGGEQAASNKELPQLAPEKEKAQEVSAGEKDAAYGNILAKVQTNPTQNPDPLAVANDAQKGAQLTDASSQMQHLIDLAQQKGVAHAVKVARHMEDNFVLDTFHDRLLADELHDALLAKGMIKDI
jgi:hypothetical protein